MLGLGAAPGLAMHILFGRQSVVDETTGSVWLDRKVGSGHRPFTGWKQGRRLLLPGARLLTVKPHSRIVKTQA